MLITGLRNFPSVFLPFRIYLSPSLFSFSCLSLRVPSITLTSIDAMVPPPRALTALKGPQLARTLVPGGVRALVPGVRTLSTSSKPRLLNLTQRPAASLTFAESRPVFRQFRRGYAADATAPIKKPGKIRFAFRWLWRLTYISVLGGVGYVGYMVWLDRHPAEQKEPDPNKKTLVILGTLNLSRRFDDNARC